MLRRWRWAQHQYKNRLYTYIKQRPFGDRVVMTAAVRFIEEHGPDEAERLDHNIRSVLLPGAGSLHRLLFAVDVDRRLLVPLVCEPILASSSPSPNGSLPLALERLASWQASGHC